MKRRDIILMAVVIAAVLAGLAVTPWARSFRRRVAANRAYEHAVAAYMLSNIAESRATFQKLAREYPDFPIAALAELKLAFLAYDEDRDLDRAEALFGEFLETHPGGVMFFPESPALEYEGELALVAEFFLGRIAYDRGNMAKARSHFEGITVEGRSKDEANLIVAEARTILRRMNEGGEFCFMPSLFS